MPAKDKPFKYLPIPLTGKWIPAKDPTELGEGDFAVLSNMRYGQGASPYSVAGMTKINTSALSSSAASISSNLVLLLHMNGQDGGTVFPDNSPANPTHVMTPVGGAITSTTTSKFGGAALRTTLASDYLTTLMGADLLPGSGAYTVDFWMNYISGTGVIWQIGNDLNNRLYLQIFGGVIRLAWFIAAAGTTHDGPTTVTTSVWHHVALVRNGGQFKVYLDGVLEITATDFTIPSYTAVMCIGSDTAYGGGASPFNGYLDEFRIHKGLAVWTAPFTPPTAETYDGTTTAGIKNGFHLKKDQPAETHVLVQNFDGADKKIFSSTTAIPSQGNLSTTLYTEAAGAGLARFSAAPDGSVICCDGKENLIYSGTESRIAGALVGSATAPITVYGDISKYVSDGVQSLSLSLTLSGASPYYLYVGALRPISAVKFYMGATVNSAGGSTIAAKYWSAGAWNAVSSPVDGTAVLTQTGTFSFTSTVSTAKPSLINGVYLYWYQFTLTGITAGTSVKYLTLTYPMQPMVDLWDGTPRALPAFVIYNATSTKYEDQTVNASAIDFSLGSPSTFVDLTSFGSSSSDDYIFVGSLEPLTAVSVVMATPCNNTITSTASTLSVQYWNGTAWTAVTGVKDGTWVDKGGGTGVQFGQNGIISWDAPARGTEFMITPNIQGFAQLFYYRIGAGITALSNSLAAADTVGTVSAVEGEIQVTGVGTLFTKTILPGDTISSDTWNSENDRQVVLYDALSGRFYSLTDNLKSTNFNKDDGSTFFDMTDFGADAGDVFYVGSLTAISALKIKMHVPCNRVLTSTRSGLAVDYWNGTAWTSTTGVYDGTWVDKGGGTGIRFGQDGIISWTTGAGEVTLAPSSSSNPQANGYPERYWYRVGNGITTLTQTYTSTGTETVSAEAGSHTVIGTNTRFRDRFPNNGQGMTISVAGAADIAVFARYYGATALYTNLLTSVASENYDPFDVLTSAEIAALGTNANDAIYVGVKAPTNKLAFKIPQGRGCTRSIASTASTIPVAYWNGSAWASVSGIVDGTWLDLGAGNGSLFNHSGTISWTASPANEAPISKATVNPTGIPADGDYYYYRIGVGITALTNDIAATGSVSIVFGSNQVTGGTAFLSQFVPGEYITLTGVDTYQVVNVISNTTLEIDRNTVAAAAVTFSKTGQVLIDYIHASGTQTFAVRNVDSDTSLQVATPVPTSGQGVNYTATGKVIMDMLETAFTYNYTVASVATDTLLYLTSPVTVGGNGADYRITGRVRLDYASGIPAQKYLSPYKFSVYWQNRPVLCGESGTRRNVVNIGSTNTSVVWNGNDVKELPIGGSTDLVAGASLFSRFGSNVFESLVLCKLNETWAVDGATPSEYTIRKISSVYGCVAPLTMVVCDVGYEVANGLNKHVCIWLSATGVMIFDLNSVQSISKDIHNYFDPARSDYINQTFVGISSAWFDERNKEYHLVIPSGSSATGLNTELVYDLLKKAWFPVARGSSNIVQCAFTATDTLGGRYTYGGLSSGYLERLENGTTFDGTSMVSRFKTKDIAIGGWMMETLIRKIKLLVRAKTTTTNQATVTHYVDGIITASTTDDPVINYPVNSAVNRTKQHVVSVRASTGVFHSFDVSMTTTNENIGFEPIGLGVLYKTVREDIADD